jgi:hypothetical protein
MDYQYPSGAVVALLPTDFITDASRKALTERLQENEYQPLFFNPADFECLSVVCDQLMAQDLNSRIVNIADACGLYDLDRKPRPVADAYKMLLK